MNAAIYARKSTDQHGVADDQKSVARQVEHARAFAVGKGWTVDDSLVFVDDGISGAEFANRPGFLRLMNALKPRPTFKVLVMSEESRLGREAIETAYALKQIVQAGVRVWFYLENRERTLETPTDKLLMSVTAFADELEREKARQRTYDAMRRKAKAGQVTGGRLFGYTNVDVVGAEGKRSHVERRINDAEADVIRRIFRFYAFGHGVKGIAKILNDERALSPRAQRGRSQSWAPSSVREVLTRDTYRGVIVWNKSKKRNTWGQQQQTARPSSEWLQVPAPHLAIVTEEEWQAAHARLCAARAVYLRGTNGQPFGRPPIGNPSKYLLTNFADCGICGSTMKALSRQHGAERARYYGCAGYHDRGRSVCTNGAVLPMDDGNAIVLEALLDDVLAPDMVEEAIDGALALIIRDDAGDLARHRRHELEKKIRTLEGQRNRLTEAIAEGGELAGLLEALKARENDLAAFRAQRDRLQASRAPTIDPNAVRVDLVTMAADWRHVLAGEPDHARPLLASLLVGRVRFTPTCKRHHWELKGQETLAGLFSRLLAPSVPLGMASPGGSDDFCAGIPLEIRA